MGPGGPDSKSFRLERSARRLGAVWFERSYASDLGLVIPGSSKRRCATALLTMEGLVVQKNAAEALLSWDSFARDWFLASLPAKPWTQTGVSAPSPRHPVVGTAAYTYGEASDAITPVLLALAVTRRLLPTGDPFAHVFKWGPVVPLHNPRPYVFGRSHCDTTVGFLCQLLHARPDFRQGLGVPARCERLRTDILRQPVGPVADHLTLRSRSMEIHNAVRSAGMTHRLGGRPIPGDPLPAEEDAVETVMHWLSGSYSDQAKTVREAEVRHVLRSDYYSIDPWPFAALTA
jgi:hypothetical protein